MNTTFTLSIFTVWLLAGAVSQAAEITLGASNTGYYWYQKSSWLGGSDTSSGFSYGDTDGLIHAQTNYQYYGGADRYWEQKDIYFQVDISDFAATEITSATFRFYLSSLSTAAETFLKHLDTQTTLATGDAAQKLAGNSNVASSTTFTLGWNNIDVTGFVQADLQKGYSFVALSLPRFGQVQDENRVLSIYGASTSAAIAGLSLKPQMIITTSVPESANVGLILGLVGVAAVASGRNRLNRLRY